jgi:hypothetical protein
VENLQNGISHIAGISIFTRAKKTDASDVEIFTSIISEVNSVSGPPRDLAETYGYHVDLYEYDPFTIANFTREGFNTALVSINSEFEVGPGSPAGSPAETSFYDEVIADSPVVYWTMDGAGTDDEIGSNDLTFANGTLTGQTPILSSGNSIITDGVNDRATATSVLSTLTLPITIEHVLTIQTISAVTMVSGTHATNASYYGVHVFILSNASIAVVLGDGTGATSSDNKTFLTATGLVSAGVPYHFVVRVNSLSSVEVIINDTVHNAPFLAGTATSISFASGLATLGYRIEAGAQFGHIKFDDTAIYNTGLSNARISAHFAATGL